MAIYDDVQYVSQGDSAAQPAAHPAAGNVLRFTQLAGAAVSLALIAGVGVWTYKLIQRDVSGIPVVRALEGPMRVQPDDPGGQPAEHQGLAVNNVAAQGSAQGPVDQVTLAPRPVGLTQEDAPMAELRPQARAAEAPAQTQVQATPEAPAQVNPNDQVAALVQELTQGIDPLEDLTPAPPTAEVIPAVVTGAGPATSRRPALRPASLRTTPAPQPAAAAPTSSARELDASALPSGTKLAQLGAYPSADVARSEWARLSKQHRDYMQGKDLVIQKAASGGRTFYRLRVAGFEDLSDARRFCAALVGQGSDCIPVSSR